nr:hypothetical protein [Tanacetum cinerariifolium]
MLVIVGMSQGLRVVESHIGNHLEDDFMPLETIRISHDVIGKGIPFELKWEAFELERRVRHQTPQSNVMNFVYAEDEEDLSFLPKEPSLGFGTGSPSIGRTKEVTKRKESKEVASIEEAHYQNKLRRKLARMAGFSHDK